MSDTDEIRELIGREYKKHIENINKSNLREIHFKYKNIGLAKMNEKFVGKSNLFNTLVGYLKGQGYSSKQINEILLVICESEMNVDQHIEDIINK